jgi:hypothetical protein
MSMDNPDRSRPRRRKTRVRHEEFEPGETYGGVRIDENGDLVNPFEDNGEEEE